MQTINKEIKEIPIMNAMLLWCSKDGTALVVNHPDNNGIGDHLDSAFGACHYKWRSKSTDEQVSAIIKEAWQIAIEDGLSVKAINDALLVVPEYRKAMTGN